MEGQNLDLIEFLLVIFFLNLNQQAKNGNGQVEKSQKKKMFENEIKKDTFDEGCEDKPNDDPSFKLQQKSDMITTPLEENDQPEMVPATSDAIDMIPTKSTIDMIPTKVSGKHNIVAAKLDRYGKPNTVPTKFDENSKPNTVPTKFEENSKPNIVQTRLEEND